MNLNVRISAELLKEAQERAAEEDMTISQLVRRFLREYANDHAKAS